MNNSDLILGVLYGEEKQLSQHYKKVDEQFPVIIGKQFWYRLTGYSNFYQKLVKNIDNMILNLKNQDFFENGYLSLAKEIEDSELFKFK